MQSWKAIRKKKSKEEKMDHSKYALSQWTKVNAQQYKKDVRSLA